MIRLHVVLCVFIFFSAADGGSHSLWVLSTFIIGDTPFPEFSAVVMLDDNQMAYYDSDVKRLIYKQYKSKYEHEEQVDASRIFEDLYRIMRDKALFWKRHLNQSHGVQVHQRLAGCALLDNDTPGPLRSWDAFNGGNEEEVRFSLQQKTLQFEGVWVAMLSHIERNRVQWLYDNIYTPICIKTLKNWLHAKKHYVMRKVKPRVRLLQKQPPGSTNVLLTCLATGFYPRHINLTLLRDGQPVSDHQITGGELLPNGDETYQMRKSLEVSAEELQHHHYTCTAEHLSLDNKLDFGLEYEPGVDAVSTVSSVLVLLVLCGTGATAAFITWKRRHRGTQMSSSSSYTATPSAEAEEASTEDTQSFPKADA